MLKWSEMGGGLDDRICRGLRTLRPLDKACGHQLPYSVSKVYTEKYI